MLEPITYKPTLRKSFSIYKGKTKRIHFSRGDLGGWKQAEASFHLSFTQSLMVHEEVYLIDIFGLIGSVGGSLGLFVGFSFFHYIVDGCDLLLSYIIQN